MERTARRPALTSAAALGPPRRDDTTLNGESTPADGDRRPGQTPPKELSHTCDAAVNRRVLCEPCPGDR